MRSATIRSFLFVALLSLPSAARADMPHSAFWLDLRVGGGASLEGGFFPTPSLVIGARFAGRVQLGGGLSYWRFAASGTDTIGTVLVSPDIAIDLFKALDDKVALYLGVSLPMGALIQNDNHFAVGYRLALGVRYSPHHNIAFGVEAGAQGLFYRPGEDSGWSNVESIYAALVGTFYSGHKKPQAVHVPPPPARAEPTTTIEIVPGPDATRAPPRSETTPSQ